MANNKGQTTNNEQRTMNNKRQVRSNTQQATSDKWQATIKRWYCSSAAQETRLGIANGITAGHSQCSGRSMHQCMTEELRQWQWQRRAMTAAMTETSSAMIAQRSQTARKGAGVIATALQCKQWRIGIRRCNIANGGSNSLGENFDWNGCNQPAVCCSAAAALSSAVAEQRDNSSKDTAGGLFWQLKGGRWQSTSLSLRQHGENQTIYQLSIQHSNRLHSAV